MDDLFYKVFHNKYLFNLILNNTYNRLYKEIKDISINSKFTTFGLKNFKYRDYLFVCKLGLYGTVPNDFINKSMKTVYKKTTKDKDSKPVYIDKDLVPENVRELYFESLLCNFNRDSVHSNVKTLILRDMRNEKNVEITLPDTVENLYIDFYVGTIELPRSLKQLVYLNGTIEYDYNQHFSSIEYLELNVPSQLNSLLPLPNLKTLILGSKIKDPIKDSLLSNSIEFLSISSQFNSLPENLKVLEINNPDIILSKSLIPPSVKCLVFKSGYKGDINNIPDSIEWLEFWGPKDFNEGLTNLPKNIKHLYFDDTFNENLIELFNYGYKLPSTLTSISFGLAFNYNLDYLYLPSSLQTIEFRSDYKLFRLSNFPKSLNIKKEFKKNHPRYRPVIQKQLINQFYIIKQFIKNPVIFKSSFFINN